MVVTVNDSRMLTIARHPGGRYAKVEFEDFQQPHWSDQAGGCSGTSAATTPPG